MVGKWHLGDDPETGPFAQGFDYERMIGKNGLDYYNYSIVSQGETVFEDDGSAYLMENDISESNDLKIAASIEKDHCVQSKPRICLGRPHWIQRGI